MIITAGCMVIAQVICQIGAFDAPTVTLSSILEVCFSEWIVTVVCILTARLMKQILRTLEGNTHRAIEHGLPAVVIAPPHRDQQGKYTPMQHKCDTKRIRPFYNRSILFELEQNVDSACQDHFHIFLV